MIKLPKIHQQKFGSEVQPLYTMIKPRYHLMEEFTCSLKKTTKLTTIETIIQKMRDLIAQSCKKLSDCHSNHRFLKSQST